MILNSLKDIPNVHCVSMAFDGLATESEFVRKHMIAFMTGTINSVVMNDCNHAAKNLRSQLVLGTSTVSGGDEIFDVGILHLAGVSQDLYRVSDYASDVLVLQLCSSDTINKLLNLLLTSSESLKGIHQQSKNNFITSCLGGIFLAAQKRYTICN